MNNKQRYIFLDFEFNTAKKIQEIISVGVIVCDTNFNIIFKYYSLVSLAMTTTMDKYASQVNHITDDTLRNARDFKSVFLELNEKLQLNKYDKIYTWGNDDKRTFDICINYHNLKEELNLMSESIFDIQKELSSKIKYNNKIVSETLALKSFKKICNIKGSVTHNALDDTIDLMNIYKKSINHEFNLNEIEKIYIERNEARKKREFIKLTINDFSKRYPNGISVNRLDGELFRKSVLLMSSKNIIYSNSSLISKSKTSASLKNIFNHEVNIISGKTYSNLKFNFNIKGRILIISVISNISKNNSHEFHVDVKKNKDLVFSLLNRLKTKSKIVV